MRTSHEDTKTANAVFWALVLVCLLLLNFQAGRLMDPMRGFLRYLWSPTVSAASRLAHSGSALALRLHALAIVRQENERLLGELKRLLQREKSLETLEKENERLRRLLGYQVRLSYSRLAAEILARDISGELSTLILGKGSSQGVTLNAPCVAFENGSKGAEGSWGLVGRVVEVGDDFCKALLLSDRQSAASVVLSPSGEEGVVEGTGSGLMLRFVPSEIRLSPGIALFTSGQGEIFPAGLPVGAVREIRSLRYESFQEAEVVPAVRSERVRDVFILIQRQ